MNIYFANWIITILVIVLSYLLTKYLIRKYFESRKGKFDATKSNYITYVALLILSTAFFSINPKYSQVILSLIVEFLNNTFNLKLTPVSTNVGQSEIILYCILCIAVLAALYLSYKQRYNQELKIIEQQKENNAIENKIRFPNDNYVESPLLHERIKELFELRFIKRSLILKEKVVQDKSHIIYGSYSDDFNTVNIFVYCDSTTQGTIEQSNVDNAVTYLKEMFDSISEAQKKPLAHYYFITESTPFNKNIKSNDIVTYLEKDFVNQIIDFQPYLLKLIKQFENEKVFSAILSDEEKKTLAQTFVDPKFQVGENKLEIKETLISYVKKWLADSKVNKHLVILGGYGMGKTSFIKYFSSSLAREILDEKNIERFPVYLNLTNTSPMHGGINMAIEAFVAKNLGVEYNLFNKLVEKGKIIFLLDAYDEMGFIGTNQQRFKQFNEIWQLATKKNKIILTGRPSYFPTEFEMKNSLGIPYNGYEGVQFKPYTERIELQKLDDTQIAQYIEKFYPNEGQYFLKWIRKNKSLHELCKRPSMMHIIRDMLKELHKQHSNDELSAGDMMGLYIEYWINRQSGKNIESAFEQNESLKLKFVKEFFIEVSISLYLNNKTKISSEEIIAKLKDFIIKSNITGFETKEAKEGFEQEILTAYFMEREGDEFRFAHKSFFEYFVSLRLIELLKAKDLKNPLIHTNWSLEIIDFIYDSIPQVHRNNPEIPALLSFVNGKLQAKIKMILFKLGIIVNHISNQITEYFFFFYLIFAIAIIPKVILSKSNNLENSNHTLSSELGSLVIHKILLFFFIVFVFVLLREKFKKSLKFTKKCVMINVSKKEQNSMKLIDWVFGINHLIIKINGVKVHKIYSSLIRQFEESVIENTEFIKSNLHRTYFYRTYFKNVKFDNVKFLKLKFVNCQMTNVDFSGLKYEGGTFIRRNFMFRLAQKMMSLYSFGKNLELREEPLIFKLEREQIDDSSIESLKQFVHTQNIDIESEIVAPDWLKEKLYGR